MKTTSKSFTFYQLQHFIQITLLSERVEKNVQPHQPLKLRAKNSYFPKLTAIYMIIATIFFKCISFDPLDHLLQIPLQRCERLEKICTNIHH
jgi:hypothetical protein